MEVSLILTTLLPAVLILPVGYLIRSSKIDITNRYTPVILGGVGWVFYSFISFIPFFIIYNGSSSKNYISLMENSRTGLFFLLIFMSIISEVVRYEFFKSGYFPIKSQYCIILFGVGWGFAEFLTRFLFFFESNAENYILSTALLLIFLLVSNAGLTTILLRSDENTKYVMFAIFVKFFTEIALFGALGYQRDFSTRFSRLYFYLIVQSIMVYLTIKTRKRVIQIEETIA